MQEDEDEQPSSFYKSKASNRFFFFLWKGSDVSVRRVQPYRWGMFQREKNLLNHWKSLELQNIKADLFCCFVFIYDHFCFTITFGDSAVFTHGDVSVAGCGSEGQTFSWWHSARHWAFHKDTFSSPQILASLDNLNSKAKLGASALLCLFINQTFAATNEKTLHVKYLYMPLWTSNTQVTHYCYPLREAAV